MPLETSAHMQTPAQKEATERQKDREQVNALSEKEQRRGRRRHMDPLTETLKCTSYYHDMRWPWLKMEVGGMVYPLSITRFYHEKNIAIDIGPQKEFVAKEKKKLCDEKGIKYACCESPAQLEQFARGLN